MGWLLPLPPRSTTQTHHAGPATEAIESETTIVGESTCALLAREVRHVREVVYRDVASCASAPLLVLLMDSQGCTQTEKKKRRSK